MVELWSQRSSSAGERERIRDLEPQLIIRARVRRLVSIAIYGWPESNRKRLNSNGDITPRIPRILYIFRSFICLGPDKVSQLALIPVDNEGHAVDTYFDDGTMSFVEPT